MPGTPKKKLLIFVVAFHAETTIESVIRRVPAHLLNNFEVRILIIDDSSGDKTFEASSSLAQQRDIPFDIRVLFNPVNQGYGGNQKLGYHYAIENGFDYVALLHGDGQYAPECLPALLEPLSSGKASGVFGSRMLTPKGALRGGMPMYKYVGNRILTYIQNKLLRSKLSEFHSGYRLYSVAALKSIPFEYNSNDFHFDTEIIIQFFTAKLPIVEMPIPTYYGDEICRVNGLRYAGNVLVATLRARLQELSLFYDRRYDCAPVPLSQYSPKLNYDSPHSRTMGLIPPNATVIDLGCAAGYMSDALKRQKGCRVTGVDAYTVRDVAMDRFFTRDLNEGLEGIPVEEHQYILLLDVIEHLASPERFLDQLREKISLNGGGGELLLSTGNIAFIVTRLMLLLGKFNYGKRGILDLTHTRLFTFASMKRTLAQAGFVIIEMKAVPAPFPLALGDNLWSRTLLKLNSAVNLLAPGLFAYQMFVRAKARPTVRSLLRQAESESLLREQDLQLARAASE